MSQGNWGKDMDVISVDMSESEIRSIARYDADEDSDNGLRETSPSSRYQVKVKVLAKTPTSKAYTWYTQSYSTQRWSDSSDD